MSDVAALPFLRACRREPTPFTPVWLMRQAGRYMPEYRAMRARHGFLELCKTPAAAAEVTLQPVERLGVDAAILFADILLVLEPLGVGLEFTKGDGPRIHRPVRSAADVARLAPVDVADAVSFVFETVRLARAALGGRVPLIGFAGAPFTLASYLVEGGASREFLHTKRFMRAEPAAWRLLMERLAAITADYLNAQIAAGAQAVQLFDSWVGTLSPADYRQFVLPASRAVIARLAPGVPVIHFGVGTATLLPLMKEAGGDVIGLDWRVELGPTWERLGHDVAVQGNLDPAILLADPAEIRLGVKTVLERGGRSPRPRLQPRPRRAPGDAGGPRARARRHGARAVGGRRTVHALMARLMADFDAVLLIAFGGPERPEDVRPFLRLVTAGRPIPAERIEAVIRHYELIGGRSPLAELTRRQAAGLARALAGAGAARPVYVGMRNWHPFLHQALAEMRDRGHRRALGIILSVLQAEASWDRYVEDVAAARAKVGEGAPEVLYAAPWSEHPRFLDAMAERVAGALEGVPAERRAAAPLVFTAHSIPVAMAAASPYVAQLEAASRAVATRLGRPGWSLAYQSRSGSPRDPWLEPDILDTLRGLALGGARDVVVAPIGFVCDHVEVLYDLDVEARQLAAELGLGFHRAGAVNDHPGLVAMLADLVARGPA